MDLWIVHVHLGEHGRRPAAHSTQIASRWCSSSLGNRSTNVIRKPLMAWNSTQKKMKIRKTIALLMANTVETMNRTCSAVRLR